jgi:RNA-binding protein NOB1
VDILVTNYAKRTGDYAALSAVDMRLLALTYQLYEENVGTDKLNLEPKINVKYRKWKRKSFIRF